MLIMIYTINIHIRVPMNVLRLYFHPKNGFLLHLNIQAYCRCRRRIFIFDLQTQQEGKRNQSMKTPAQSLLGSYASSLCHLYFCSQEQSRLHLRVVVDLITITKLKSNYIEVPHLRTDLLLNSLLEFLVVEDGSHFPVTVAGPEGC